MSTLPKKVNNILENFSVVFTAPSFKRFKLLLLAAILTTGARTICNLLRTVEFFVEGHRSSYHSVFSKRRWSMWKLSYVLVELILNRFEIDETIYLTGDDTVDEHPGLKVFGKGKHRDAVRSSHTFTAFLWGHKWVVLSILVKFPFAHRPWALPVMAALYYPPTVSKKLGRRHRTPREIMKPLLALLIRSFPERKFLFSADGAYAVHHLAKFCQTHKNLIFVSKFYPNASLYSLPSPRKNGAGRPRTKGDQQLCPEVIVKKTKERQTLKVRWYGGENRNVEVVTGTGHWYKSGDGLVQVRWVFVHDLDGIHRDEYFFITDIRYSAKRVIETYTGRWSLEVTFEEVRAYIGFGTTRGWTQKTVTRQAPCLLVLFSIVALIFDQLPPSIHKQSMIIWVGKKEITFSDAITSVRRYLWKEWIFEALGFNETLRKLPHKIQRTLLYNLAPAA